MKMDNKKEFENMRKKLKKSYEEREEIISKSREVLRLSKSSIYSTHREEIKEAETQIKKAKKIIGKLRKLITVENKNNHFHAALQEYIEAVCFLNIIKNNELTSIKELGVGVEDYLCGIADVTGELGRKSVILATKKDKKGVENIRNLVDSIYGEMTKFDFRNSEIRRKFDSIKWNLKKIEELTYDLSK